MDTLKGTINDWAESQKWSRSLTGAVAYESFWHGINLKTFKITVTVPL